MRITMGDRVRRRRTLGTTAVMALAVVLSSFPLAHGAPAAPVITSPTHGGLAPGAVPVRGTGPTGTTIEIFEGAQSRGTTTVAATGTWTKVVPLTQGTHTLFAVSSTSPSGVSAPSNTITFEVDSTRPVTAIAAPAANEIVTPGSAFEVLGGATDNRGLYAVKIEYWSVVGRLALRALAACVCEGTSSEWSHTPNLAPGAYSVVSHAYDQAGNSSLGVSRTFVMTSSSGLPAPLPAVPGAPPTPVIQVPPAGSIQPGADKPIRFGGKAGAGTTVKLTERSFGPLGTVRTDSRGFWQYQVWLPTGAYAVTAQAFDARGRLSAPTKILGFTVDADRPDLTFLTQDNTVFLPLQPIRIEGRLFDNRRVAGVRLEYWLLDRVVEREWAQCVGCSTTDALWSATPELPYPGTYAVVARGYDGVGNQAWSTEITIVKLA